MHKSGRVGPAKPGPSAYEPPSLPKPLESGFFSKDPEGILRDVFRLDGYREGQKETIDHVLARKDTFAVFPTGSGKSLCYQIPAIVMRPSLTVVISPLKALMNDQVEKLRALGIRADTYHSDLQEDERRAVMAAVRSGDTTILLISPERFSTEDMLGAISARTVAQLVVDEAHCMSVWGHDFRISYLNIRNVHNRIRSGQEEPPVLLFLSATAPAHIRKDIRNIMGLERTEEVILPPLRDNLSIDMEFTWGTGKKVFDVLLEAMKGAKGKKIVYCNTVRETEELAQSLTRAGIRSRQYHGQMDAAYKKMFLEDFMRSKVEALCCTSAFGMGIDIPDIRLIVHYKSPATLEDYYQQAGRAGRDGKPARCLLLAEHAYSKPSDEVRTPITFRSLSRLYCQLYESQEKAYAFNPGRPRESLQLSLAQAVDRIRSPGAKGRKGWKKTAEDKEKEADSRFSEGIRMAALGFLIDNRFILVGDDNKISFTTHPDKLEVNPQLLAERERSKWAKADAMTHFMKLDDSGRREFLARYLTDSIDEVMQLYPSTLEKVLHSLRNIVERRPGLTARRYAMILTGASRLKEDEGEPLLGILPHLGYRAIESKLEDLADAGLLKEHLVKDKGREKIVYSLKG
ncbi:MAG: RecQ family ATP-dependent DNA helicase [Candidatus Micrarchaeota archaeon]